MGGGGGQTGETEHGKMDSGSLQQGYLFFQKKSVNQEGNRCPSPARQMSFWFQALIFTGFPLADKKNQPRQN